MPPRSRLEARTGRASPARPYTPPGSRQHRFEDTADPDAFYPSPLHESARADLFAAVKTLAGLIVLTGEPGTGKTTVLHRVTRDVEGAGERVLWCSVAALQDAKVAALARRVDTRVAAAPEAGIGAILATLHAQTRHGGSIVVAIDEAQRLRRADLEELRSLTEIATTSGTRLAILLVGQPDLDLKLARLAASEGAPAHAHHVVLPRLGASEVGPYVAYRLRLSGARKNDVFEPGAIERVAAHAKGVPRVINQLCDASLHIAGRAGAARVSASIVDAAAAQLALQFSGRHPAVGAARHARRERPPAEARRARSGLTTARARPGRAGVALAILVAALLGAPRPISAPPPASLRGAAPLQAEAPARPPITLEHKAPTPVETARVPTPAAPAAPDRLAKVPPDDNPNPARQPADRAGTRSGTPSPLASQPPAPAVARNASPMALALLDNAEAGNLTEVRALLAAGISPDARDSSGTTPLMVAVIHNHGAVAEVLLARGADVNVADNRGVTASMLAASNGRTALLQRLVGRGANINARTDAGWTPLTYAAWNGHAPAVRRLLEAGADPALTDRIGWTALQYAMWRAADISRARIPDVGDSLPPEKPEPAEATQLRYTEVVSLLNGATRRR